MERVERVATIDERCELCGLTPVIGTLRRSLKLVAESAPMRSLLQRAGRFAASDAPVVIFGESGTGKELVARALHASSTRAAMPFVPVNIAALPPELLESELFGHARGAFTGAHQARQGLFEAAAGGTLFLDEIGEMPAALQAKLLRVLQEGEVRRVGETRAFAVDVRIIYATHRDLAERVQRGDFREDLFYRISVLTLRVPPLRERAADVLPLARQMLDEEGSGKRLSPEAEARLEAHVWPGNVRELDNALRHGVALADGQVIRPEHLPDAIAAGAPRTNITASGGETPRRLSSLADSEREHVLAVLAACDGSVVEAARILEIGRNTLWRKLKSWG